MHYSGFYQGKNKQEIEKYIKHEGFDPALFTNNAGDVYSLHSHPETKLLAFLSGSMQIKVGDKTYLCKAGDKLIIPGNTAHSAKVGRDGCTFFWAEKII